MLRLVDALTGTTVPFERPRGSALWLCVDPGFPVSPQALRTVVVADVLRRVLEELHDLQVLVTLIQPADGGGRDLRAELDALWVRPPTLVVDTIPDRPVHLVVGPSAPGAPFVHNGRSPIWLSVGAVEVSADTADEMGLLLEGRDPLAARLALLSTPYGKPMALGPDEMRRAEDTLRRWRDAVAACADHPSAAMPRWVVDRAYSGLENNISTPSLLSTVTLLEADKLVPPGAKFETLVHLDRFLALDLPRHLGAHA